MNKPITFWSVISLLALAGCSLPWQSVEMMLPEGPLANFRAEPTGKLGTPVPVTAYVVANDGCVKAGWATAEVDEAQRVVVILGAAKRVRIPEVACTAAVHYPSITTTFTPQSTGTYIIKAMIAPDLSAAGETGGYSHLQPEIVLDYGSHRTAFEATQAVVVSE